MKIRLLLVDDEKEFIDSLADRLSLRDYDVAVAYGGEQGLSMALAQNYDVVILDVFMPDKDGLTVLRALKTAKPLTEVLMLSGHAEVETAIEGMKAGAYDFLLKPAQSEELFAKIEAASNRKAAQEQRIRDAKVAQYVSSPRSALND